jgi:hypothetical protein
MVMEKVGQHGALLAAVAACLIFLQLALLGVDMPIGAVGSYLRRTGTFEGDAGEKLRC